MNVELPCATCGKLVVRRRFENRPIRDAFCSMACKAEMQRRQKPVDREWLYQKYVVEGLDCTQIAALVNRNSKRVWEWIRDYGIPTRRRGTTPQTHRFQPGHKLGVGRRHTAEARERLRQARIRDGHVPYLKNGVHHLKGKRGAETPGWKGGVTAERQAVYGTQEWKDCVKAVWRRDDARCRRCGHDARLHDRSFDVHHVVSFAVKELRCEVSNLVLLCEPCHYWVHSAANTEREHLG